MWEIRVVKCLECLKDRVGRRGIYEEWAMKGYYQLG